MDESSPETHAPRVTEIKENLPPSSTNQRIEAIYSKSPEMANREYTLPCITRPIYQSDIATTDPEVGKLIDDHRRVIIAPATYDALPEERKEEVAVLASAYENGRVLEADNMVVIDGEAYVITVKGVGATEFIKKSGGTTPWRLLLDNKDVSVKDDEKLKLAQFPFHDVVGVMTADAAFTEVEGAQDLQSKGADTEKILEIHEILEMPDEHGVMRPISYFQEKGIITSEDAPVLEFRAAKSNFRLLEPVMMDMLGKKDSVPDFLQHALARFGQHTATENPTFQQYVYWLTNKLYNQQLPLVLDAYDVSSGKWQDLGRNISLLGEELDLEEVEIDERATGHPESYFRHIDLHYGALEEALRRYIDHLYPHTDGSFDFRDYGKFVWGLTKERIASHDFTDVYQKLTAKGTYHESLENVRNLAVRNLGRVFTDQHPVRNINDDKIMEYWGAVEEIVHAEEQKRLGY